MADDADEYVVSSALMSCTQGTVPGLFQATPRTTKVMGLIVGNETDKKPLANIPSFGICQKLTQAAGGTPVPCMPVCPTWQKTYPATIGGARALLKMSCTNCTTGQGKVEFMTSGQIPLSADALRDLNEAHQQQADTLEQAEKEKNSVGEAGLLEGAIPVWGSGRDLIHAAQTGDGWGVALNAGFLVWDVASVAAGVVSFGTATVAMAGAKAGAKTLIKAGSHVALGMARKEATQLIARSAALHAGFKETVLASRKALGKLCVRACFTADTPVHTRFGPRPIAEVQVGDEVWAWEEHSQQAGWKTVLEVYRSQTAELAELHFGEVLLRLTPAHWLYAETAGWTAAGDLQPGQRVHTRTGKLLPLLSKQIHIAPATVYNLEVADYHTYFAGVDELLAHNKCDALTEMVDIGAGVLKKRLKPNTSYVRNGYEYATDAYGRIKKAGGELRLEPHPTRARTTNPSAADYMQGLAGKKDGRKAGDAGGHLIGDQFGGAGNNANLVAMKHEGVNAYPNGKWGAMEKRWADALNDNKKVKVDIEPIYKDASARPHAFEVTEWINGVEKTHTINNF